jgi:hypothetical protein
MRRVELRNVSAWETGRSSLFLIPDMWMNLFPSMMLHLTGLSTPVPPWVAARIPLIRAVRAEAAIIICLRHILAGLHQFLTVLLQAGVAAVAEVVATAVAAAAAVEVATAAVVAEVMVATRSDASTDYSLTRQ